MKSKVQLIACLALLVNIALVAYFIPSLPQEIPMHFNFQGTPDSWSDKSSLWVLPGVALFTFVAMFFARKAKSYNTHKPADPILLRKMVDHMNLACQILFMVIIIQTIRTSLKHADGLGNGFFVLAIFLVCYPLWFYFKAVQKGA